MSGQCHRYLVAEIERLKEYPTDDCVEWPFCKNGRGYGKVGLGGHMKYVHRLAYTLHYGSRPEKFVLHHCDNPSCFNPAHLFVGNQCDNMQDCTRKERLHPAFTRSELSIVIHLTLKGIPSREIAKLFKVHQATVCRYMRRMQIPRNPDRSLDVTQIAETVRALAQIGSSNA